MIRALVWILLMAATGAWAATSSPDADRCRAHGSVDACYDAIRRNPSDPGLLTSLGDAFARANRPVDALRTYRRAASLAPSDRGVAEKIAALETKPPPKRVSATTSQRAADQSTTRRYSNAAPESQSH
jgi:cytochrome c-type biogenesis protein CcmH/NrfG